MILGLVMTSKKSSRDSHRAHDKFVREVFSDLNIVRDFLSVWLPKDLLTAVDLDCLAPLPTSMISQMLGGSEAIVDFLFETKFSGQQALVYFLVEHKSYPDKFVPLQAHVYQASAWWAYHKNNPGKQLPLIFTIVLHHGKKPYDYSKDLRSLIDAPPALVEAYVLRPFHLIDLSKIPDDALGWV